MGSSAGKGDTQRPMSVSPAVFAENWNRAFKQQEAECSGTKQTKNPTKMMDQSQIGLIKNCAGSVSPALEHEIKNFPLFPRRGPYGGASVTDQNK